MLSSPQEEEDYLGGRQYLNQSIENYSRRISFMISKGISKKSLELTSRDIKLSK